MAVAAFVVIAAFIVGKRRLRKTKVEEPKMIEMKVFKSSGENMV
jgi:hypothetical protein